MTNIETLKMTNIENKVFVLTGTLSIGRKEATSLIESAGGLVKSSLTKDTNYLVAGDEAGSKLYKAEELGIAILDEYTFRKLLGLPTEDIEEEDSETEEE